MLLPSHFPPIHHHFDFFLHHSCTPSPCPCTRRVPSWALFVLLLLSLRTLARLGQRKSTSNNSLFRVPATPTTYCTSGSASKQQEQAYRHQQHERPVPVALASVKKSRQARASSVRQTDTDRETRDTSPLPPAVHLPTHAPGRDPAWTWT